MAFSLDWLNSVEQEQRQTTATSLDQSFHFTNKELVGLIYYWLQFVAQCGSPHLSCLGPGPNRSPSETAVPLHTLVKGDNARGNERRKIVNLNPGAGQMSGVILCLAGWNQSSETLIVGSLLNAAFDILPFPFIAGIFSPEIAYNASGYFALVMWKRFCIYFIFSSFFPFLRVI